MKSYTTVDEYIKAAPKEAVEELKKLRAFIIKTLPKAEEVVSYGIPTYKLFNKNVVHFGGFKTHIGLYPGPSGIIAFRKELLGYECSKGTIKFPLGKPLPYPLIKKIVTYRAKETEALIKDKARKKD